jgi:hypothetical protein
MCVCLSSCLLFSMSVWRVRLSFKNVWQSSMTANRFFLSVEYAWLSFMSFSRVGVCISSESTVSVEYILLLLVCWVRMYLRLSSMSDCLLTLPVDYVFQSNLSACQVYSISRVCLSIEYVCLSSMSVHWVCLSIEYGCLSSISFCWVCLRSLSFCLAGCLLAYLPVCLHACVFLVCIHVQFIYVRVCVALLCMYCIYCSLSLWRVARGSKLMRLELIHGLFIT